MRAGNHIAEREASKLERGLLFTTLTLAILSASYLGFGLIVKRANPRGQAIDSSLREHVLGPKGVENKSKPLLIEFGDFQCPPCMASSKIVGAILTSAGGNLEYRFRNFPLSDIHPDAYRFATIAEEARSKGRFALIHNLFYSGLNSADLEKKLHILKLDPEHVSEAAAKQARCSVDLDLADARVLGLRGTPSFILYRPDGSMELTNLDLLQHEFAPSLR